ncbi:MAG: hypothetical protein JNN12_16955 [Bacteroidetes Order II. Incertae sedis bacterium]|nr:hypothetical protein [Bacteroidetes Order II. bacterium]
MTAIIFSTQQEAQYFLKQYHAGRFDGLTEGQYDQDNNLIVAITGVGKIKATLRSEQIIKSTKPSKVLHIGTATKYNPQFENNEFIACTQVFEGDRSEFTMPIYPRLSLETPFKHLKEGILVTQEHVSKDPKDRVYWQKIADLSDMESYAIVFVAASNGVPCYVTKVAIGESKNVPIKTVLQKGYQQISTFLLDALAQKMI